MATKVTKKEVIHFIKHDRTLIKARSLYDQLPNKNLSTNSYLGRLPGNKASVRIACYELCKLVGIPERQMNVLLLKPVKAEPKIINEDLEKLKQKLEIEATQTKVSSDVVNTKKISETTEEPEEPKKLKPTLKLREQFPFLSDKDCPKELHLVTAGLISAYEKLIEEQPKLHKNGNQEDMQKNAQEVLKSYILKKEAFAELEYYAENKALLGKHPIFEQIKEENAILKMDSLELSKKQKNILNRLNRNKAKAKAAENKENELKSLALVERDESLMLLVEKELKSRK